MDLISIFYRVAFFRYLYFAKCPNNFGTVVIILKDSNKRMLICIWLKKLCNDSIFEENTFRLTDCTLNVRRQSLVKMGMQSVLRLIMVISFSYLNKHWGFILFVEKDAGLCCCDGVQNVANCTGNWWQNVAKVAFGISEITLIHSEYIISLLVLFLQNRRPLQHHIRERVIQHKIN